MMKALKAKVWIPLVAIAATALMTGCEDDKSLGDGHDFGDNDPGVVVALGDSITRGGFDGTPYPAQLSPMIGKVVHNEGVSGEHSASGAARAASVLARHKPGFLLVLYGANDIVHAHGTGTIIRSLRSIVNTARDNKTIPVLATLTPAYGLHDFMQGKIEEVNQRIRELAVEEGVVLVPAFAVFGTDESLFIDDGLHPNGAGNTRLAQAFAGAF